MTARVVAPLRHAACLTASNQRAVNIRFARAEFLCFANMATFKYNEAISVIRTIRHELCKVFKSGKVSESIIESISNRIDAR